MRLRVLETSAGPVLVLDRCTQEFVNSGALTTSWPSDFPKVVGFLGEVEIPGVDPRRMTDLMRERGLA